MFYTAAIAIRLSLCLFMEKKFVALLNYRSNKPTAHTKGNSCKLRRFIIPVFVLIALQSDVLLLLSIHLENGSSLLFEFSIKISKIKRKIYLESKTSSKNWSRSNWKNGWSNSWFDICWFPGILATSQLENCAHFHQLNVYGYSFWFLEKKNNWQNKYL